jgi:hypothetical protein
VRALTFAVGLSLLAVGLLGALASEFSTKEHSTPLSEAVRAPPGSRVMVRGLLEDVRAVAGGAALSSITDCAGNRATVFFAGGAPANASWRLAALDAVVAVYRGAPELVVGDPGHVGGAGESAVPVAPDALEAGWRSFLCRPVAVRGPIAWAHVSKADPRSIEVGLVTSGQGLLAVAHSDTYVELTVSPGAVATFVGVVAAAPDGASPVIHVRL